MTLKNCFVCTRIRPTKNGRSVDLKSRSITYMSYIQTWTLRAYTILTVSLLRIERLLDDEGYTMARWLRVYFNQSYLVQNKLLKTLPSCNLHHQVASRFVEAKQQFSVGLQ